MVKFLKTHWKILSILFFIFLLRVPSFFEPYWYGDEGIYLAIGQALQRGAVLYRDIWDNKTPLLYFIYAIIPTLLWAKLTATIFVLGTATFVYKITKYIIKEDSFALLSMTLTGILLSLPIFEGTIANAELYFTLPIAATAYLLLRHSDRVQNLLIGFLFTIAFLIKVPAVFDFLGLFLAYFLIKKDFKPFFIIGIVFVTIIVPIFFYFHLNNGLGDFITAAFKQNSSYIAIDSGPLSKLSNPLFVKAFLLLLALLVSLVLFIKKRISSELLFLIFWFGFSLYGALLSNRPYLHYLLQIIPPSIILLFYLIKKLLPHDVILERSDRIFFLDSIVRYAHSRMTIIVVFIFLIFIFFSLIRMFTGAFALDVRSYYTNWFDYVYERKTWEQYANYFDGRTVTNYQIGNYIKKNSLVDDSIFVWGDNAFIYVLSERKPATKFIQAHHLTTIPKENYDFVANKILTEKPKIIVITRPVNFDYPKLEALVSKNYSLISTFGVNFVYKLR